MNPVRKNGVFVGCGFIYFSKRNYMSELVLDCISRVACNPVGHSLSIQEDLKTAYASTKAKEVHGLYN